MCGIIGFIDKKNYFSRAEKKAIGQKMLEKINHRGGDNINMSVSNNVLIGHSRLKIINITEFSNQPFTIEDSPYIISYNGEIYNHIQLRKFAPNEKFCSNSDTETLFKVYENIGEKIFGEIRGMFAVSIYNKSNDTILLAIDQFGIKPLYYLETDEWFAWASEVKAFSVIPNINFSINKNILSEYGIFRSIIGSDTHFKDIKKLNPGETLAYNIEKSQTDIYKYNVKKSIGNNILKTLKESIIENTLSDVPIGIQLSGGVDSSLVAGILAKYYKSKRFHSFSIGLEDENWNEFKYSRKISKKLNTIHKEIVFTEYDFCNMLPQAIYHLDEPLNFPNTVPIMILSLKARKYVKVLLSGEGADEIFGGYIRYQNILKSTLKNNTLLYSNSFCTPAQIKSVITCNSKNNLIERRSILKATGCSTLQKLSHYDIKTYLPSLLLRQDKMGMAANLECRFPYLDTRLVSTVFELSDSEKIFENNSKIVLKKIAINYLPKDIIVRKKCGFGLPMQKWFRNENGLGKYLKYFTQPKINRTFFDYNNISSLIKEHIAGKKDNSEVLWVLINIEIWTMIFIDNINPDSIWRDIHI